MEVVKKGGDENVFFEVEISINNIITSSTRSTLASRFSNCIVVEGDWTVDPSGDGEYCP